MRIFLLIFIFLPFTLSSQFIDNFSDGNFTADPAWEGEVSHFEIDTSNRLHLVAPSETSTSYLSTASEAVNDASWEFTVEFDFNPTSSNMAQVYLTASSADLESELQGYFVRIGNTSKEISLYRQDGFGDVDEIIDGVDDILDMDPVICRIKVTRSVDGDWELMRDNLGGENYISEGTVIDNTYESSSYFGVFCKYTSTLSDKFYYSNFDVTGEGFVDVESPTLVSQEVLNQNQVALEFSEPMDQSSIELLTNYNVNNGIGNPTSIVVTNSQEVTLIFAENFIDGEINILILNNLTDLSGNVLNTSTEFTFYIIGVPMEGDLIINEIMADPSPSVGLPEAEYLELHNTSDISFDLSEIALYNSSTQLQITGILPGGGFLIITHEDDENSFTGMGNVLGLSSFTALANTDDSMTLASTLGEIIDVVSYTDEWYMSSTQSNGGYSLERINPFLSCSGITNWAASSAPNGGTPGQENAIYNDAPDLTPPSLLEVFVNSDQSLVLSFDKPLLSEDVITAKFLIDNGIDVSDVALLGNNQIIVSLGSNLLGGTLYTITVNNLQDCSGNMLLENNSISFGLPEQVQPGDIVINEILSNPRPQGSDFIEIYNKSLKYLTLRNCKLTSIVDGELDGFNVITTDNKLISPGDYLVFTVDRINILEEYDGAVESNLFEIPNLPSMDDDEGNIIFVNGLNEVIDYVVYNDSFHFELLDDTEGVSIERLNFFDPSNDPGNWHSASQVVGYATPGYENSQTFEFGEQEQNYTIQPRVISPDNDGFEDLMAIHYEMDSPDFVANISILDAHGRLVKYLTKNQLLGLEGTIYWDGLLEEELKAPIGLYVIYLEFYDLEGNVEMNKEVVTVAAKL